MEVYAKYLDFSQTKTNPALMAVAASLAGGNPAVMGIEGGLSAPAATSASGSNGLAGLLTGKQQNDGAPPAYLNYLFFDQEMNYKYGGFPDSFHSRDQLSRCRKPPKRMRTERKENVRWTFLARGRLAGKDGNMKDCIRKQWRKSRVPL